MAGAKTSRTTASRSATARVPAWFSWEPSRGRGRPDDGAARFGKVSGLRDLEPGEGCVLSSYGPVRTLSSVSARADPERLRQPRGRGTEMRAHGLGTRGADPVGAGGQHG